MSITFTATDSNGQALGEINLANGNALMIMEVLNVPQEYCGEWNDLATIERRCVDTLNVLQSDPALDSGRQDVVDAQPGGATLILCAQPDGYLTSRVGEIRLLCEKAMLAEGKIIFG